MKKKSGFLSGWSLVLFAVCVVLSLILIGFLVWNYKMEASESERLKKQAGQEVKIYVAAEEDSAGDGTGEESDKTEEAQPMVKGIACWGDEFFRGEEIEQYSYRVTLQELLLQNGYELEVEGKTLSGASTLSLMTMAGVSSEEVSTYVTAHQEAAGGEELPVTETGIRDLTQEQMERTEADYIPVIFMGYYGGWNHDPQELIEQQKKILETFSGDPNRYIVAGIRPMDGSVSRADYDAAMEEAWGERYISVAEAVTQGIGSREGQEEIGRAIYDKLVELAYITKE